MLIVPVVNATDVISVFAPLAAKPVIVPPKVKLPELVTDPDKVKPLTVPVPPTEVTVPNGFVAQEVSVPLVVRYLPELDVWLGTNALKAALAVVAPVPPLAMATVPVTLAEVPVVF